MTNHGETTGSSGNGDISGRSSDNRGIHGRAAREAHDPAGADDTRAGTDEHIEPVEPVECLTYEAHGSEHQVTLRTPAELADALPYLLGYRPEDSIVLVALHDRSGRGRFGGRARLGIPANEDDWADVARQLAHGLITGSERRGAKPEQMVAYLCQEPATGESGRHVMERLASLAGMLRTECGRLEVPVIEALCIADGRFWSYCCPSEGCCPPEGQPMGLPGTSVLAAAATYAGIQVRGTLREMRSRLQPWETAAALQQEAVLDTTSMRLVPRMLDEVSRAEVAEETMELAGRVLTRFAEAPPVAAPLQADLRDDELLGHDEAATLILGLQDRTTRDRAAEWMEGDEAGPALRLWRALARRCVGPYGEHAAAPLTLAGWVAWSTADGIEAREALAMALGADPGYFFARLLHQACNEDLDPESIRRCLRAERERRARSGGGVRGDEQSTPKQEAATGTGGVQPAPAPSSGTASRRRRRTRSAACPDSGPGSAGGGGRQPGGRKPGVGGSRPRTRAAAGSRPGARRPGGAGPRISGNDVPSGSSSGSGSPSPGSDAPEGRT